MLGWETKPLNSTAGEFVNSFVGYIDILGFGNMIENKEKQVKIVEAYQDIQNKILDSQELRFPIEVSKMAGIGPHVGQPVYDIITFDKSHVYMISDSIFFIIVPHKQAYIYRYGLTSILLMNQILSICWQYNLPARGAISDGKVYFDSNRKIFIGPPLVRAVEWESTQNFAWFSLEPTSWIARTAENESESLISKNLFKFNLDYKLFKQEKIKKLKAKWKFKTNLVFCSYPDLHTLQSTVKPLYSKFSHISQVQIDHILKKNLEITSEKERKYWENTSSLFSRMGVVDN